MLGDFSALAWSNLGFWHSSMSYPQACQNLARHLANAVDLNAQDTLLDLGCGQGASLQLWQDAYSLADISAVELQASCIARIQNSSLTALKQLHQGSFLNLAPQQFAQPFNVILCIDALYHHAMPEFLASIQVLLASNGRLGVHYLQLNDAWKNAPFWKKWQYRYLLKMADIQLAHLSNQQGLIEKFFSAGFNHVQIDVLTQPVFSGFANYVHSQLNPKQLRGLDGLKIKMTAKLCKKFAQDGLIDYVQITAQR
ncbi:methyltransferase domain-containing protein [Acinetobacter sp. MD2(2019)]|nr:methyltransferase domain-containing protein [Acinetobacter sp. MD2(2019)]